LGWFFATISGALIFGIGGFFIKYGSIRHELAGTGTLLGLYLMGTICFISYAAYQQELAFTIPLLIAGIIIGLGSVVGNVFWIRAFHHGPSSLTGPIINIYNVLVMLMSVFFFGETLAVKEFIAILLILISLGLINYDPNEALRIKDRLWFVLIVAAIFFFFLRTGGLKISDEMGLNNTLILAYGYAVGIVWFGILLIGQEEIHKPSILKHAFGWGLVSGVCSFAGMQLFSYAIATGPASIVAPVFAMNGLIFATLTIIVLGERLSRYQIIAMMGCVVGLVLLRI
jgi:drug/metabolite transporter (DMT)-like permease